MNESKDFYTLKLSLCIERTPDEVYMVMASKYPTSFLRLIELYATHLDGIAATRIEFYHERLFNTKSEAIDFLNNLIYDEHSLGLLTDFNVEKRI